MVSLVVLSKNIWYMITVLTASVILLILSGGADLLARCQIGVRIYSSNGDCMSLPRGRIVGSLCTRPALY